MFGFGKRKNDRMIEQAAAMAALAIFLSEKENKIDLSPFTNANKQIICTELDRLKTDHWDKNAFDALIEFVETL